MRKKHKKYLLYKEAEIMDAQKTGSFIAQMRKEKNLTQLQLAELLNVSDKAVSRWETGRGFPDIGSLEDIAGALGVGVAELLKGEKINETLPAQEVIEITDDGISLMKRLIGKKKFAYSAAGFLAGFLLIILCVVHINSPVYITDPYEVLTLETLSNGKIAAILNDKAAGYEIERIKQPDSEEELTFLSCYKTKLSELFGKTGETVVIIGDSESTGRVYYYPTEADDILLYSGSAADQTSESIDGVQTLPRLIYNYWILLGAALTAAGIAVFIITRKKYYSGTVLKAALLPASFTAATALCLAGNSGQVFNAPYYLSGIALSTILIYALLLIIITKLINRPSRKGR